MRTARRAGGVDHGFLIKKYHEILKCQDILLKKLQKKLRVPMQI